MDQPASLFLHDELLEGLIVPRDVYKIFNHELAPSLAWKAEAVDPMSTDKQLSFLEVSSQDEVTRENIRLNQVGRWIVNSKSFRVCDDSSCSLSFS